MRVGHAAVVFTLSAVSVTGFAAAQFQNPIQAAKDAYKNAKQQSQQQKPGQTQNQQTAPTQVASAASPSAAGSAQSPGPSPANLDIIGIKPGTSMSDAMQALKADNPKMKIRPVTFQHAEFKDSITVEVDGQDVPATENDQVTHATETVQLMFTPPPSPPAVWAISRYYEFATTQRPSTQTTMDALRKKYGPETIPPGTPIGEQTLTWIFDPQGKPITAGGAQMNTACASTLQMYVANSGMGAQTENINLVGTNMPQWPQACTSMIVLTARLQIEQVAPNQYSTKVLTVTLEDGGRYMRALAQTKAVIAAAAKAQQDKQTNQMNQVGAPKL